MSQLRTGKIRRRTLLSIFAVAFALMGRAAYAQCSDVPVCASGVFCTNFEEANPKALWDDYDGNPDSTNLVMVNPGPCATPGNRVMRLRVPAGRGAADLVKELPSSHDKLYARWYQFWEVGYDFTAENHGGGLHAGARGYLGQSGNRPTGADWFTAWFEPLAFDYGKTSMARPTSIRTTGACINNADQPATATVMRYRACTTRVRITAPSLNIERP